MLNKSEIANHSDCLSILLVVTTDSAHGTQPLELKKFFCRHQYL